MRGVISDCTVSYQLDAGLLDSKDDKHRGYWALAELLRRIEVRDTTKDVPDMDIGSVDVPARGAPRQPLTPRRSRPYEMHDVYAAIERRDIDTIMAIRTAQFDLLLGMDESAGNRVPARSPLEYAVSLGPKYQQVALFLVGAFSRFVNQLPDTGVPDVATQETLRKLRANLKLAIDSSVLRDETSLVASYIQVLVMSEGTPWLLHTVHNVVHELYGWAGGTRVATGVVPQPINVARDAISAFLTANLRTRRRNEQYIVAAVEDYTANATGDLVLLALWTALPGADELPYFAFARDERVSAAFCEQVSAVGRSDAPAASPRAARLWRAAEQIVEMFSSGVRSRTAAERLAVLERVLR